MATRTVPDNNDLPFTRGRLAAFLEIHEHWEFDEGVTEESFDEWLHENIRAMKRYLATVSPSDPSPSCSEIRDRTDAVRT